MITEAKQISTEKFLEAVDACLATQNDLPWAMRWLVLSILVELMGEDIPEKVFLAKAERLISSGVMHGCECGCRGDYHRPGVPNKWCC